MPDRLAVRRRTICRSSSGEKKLTELSVDKLLTNEGGIAFRPWAINDALRGGHGNLGQVSLVTDLTIHPEQTKFHAGPQRDPIAGPPPRASANLKKAGLKPAT